MVTKRINIQGEVCPVPLLTAKKELHQLNQDDILVIETDSHQTVRNLMRWCEDHELSFEIDETDNGVWLVSIIKGELTSPD